MAEDPFGRLVRQQERQQADLERLLEAAGQAALADTLAGLWTHVLGARTVIVAASMPPNPNGLELAAKRLWETALQRWIYPSVTYVRQQRGLDTDLVSFARLWERIAERMSWTVDLIVQSVQKVLASAAKESPDMQRSAVAEVLALDAVSFSLWEEIHKLELELQDPELSFIDTDASYARRVRLQTNAFLLNASRARSKGFAAQAQFDPEHGDEWRRLARQASRPAADVRQAERELARHDEKLFHNTEMDPDRFAQLSAKLVKLHGEGRYGHESWRNSITRDARAVATGLLTSANLQYALEQSRATGEPWVKVWAATHDTRVRPTHLAADRQVRPLDQPFDVGDAKLDNPADFDAPGDEFWGCRCSMPVLSRADYDAIAAVLVAASTQEETMTEPAAEEALGDLPPLMWHGVITREGTYTGDRRYFRENAIRGQEFPWPMRFQREDWGGHQGAVVTANAEAARRYEKEIRAWGTFGDGTLTPEVEEVIGLFANRQMRGVSIDGDDVLDSQFTLELDDDGNAYEMYDSMRIRGATFCAIPAFDGAEIYLGPPPPEWLLEGEPIEIRQNEPTRTRPLDDISDTELEAMLAASRVPENLAEYWTVGEGAAKIRWGTSGDFNRCRQQLAQYVSPGQLSGMCANLHHRALGQWPGQEAALNTPYLVSSVDVADINVWRPARETFMPRELGELTPITIEDDGTVFGHLFDWQSCHAGFEDRCIRPPRSETNYAMFHLGAVRLDDGTDLPIGKLTVGSGHASPSLGMRAAVEHYDNTSTAVAEGRIHEDKWGGQFSGRIIPGTPIEKIEELRRSPISGDWRIYRGNLELIAGLGVNAPGFPIPRAMVASVEGGQISLVAAGYVPHEEEDRQVAALAERMHAPLVASLAERIAPTQDELNARAAALAARMEQANGGN